MSEASSEAVNPPAPQHAYFAVVLHSDGAFVTEEFDSLAALVIRLRELVDRDVSVSCFTGARLAISKPPLRYLMTPEGNHALFEVPEAPEPDDTGYLGVDPIHMGDPPQLKMPQGARPSPGAPDEFFDDRNDNVLGVFDNVLPDPDS
jgi:hypothetical protein